MGKDEYIYLVQRMYNMNLPKESIGKPSFPNCLPRDYVGRAHLKQLLWVPTLP